MCIRDSVGPALDVLLADADDALERAVGPDVAADYDTLAAVLDPALERLRSCLLYTSDAADERSSVDLGGRRIIKKKKRGNTQWVCRNRQQTEDIR